MKCLVSWVTYEPKLRPTMQCHVGFFVKLLLDECRDVLLDVVLLESLRGAVDSVLLHVLGHVSILDHSLRSVMMQLRTRKAGALSASGEAADRNSRALGRGGLRAECCGQRQVPSTGTARQGEGGRTRRGSAEAAGGGGDQAAQAGADPDRLEQRVRSTTMGTQRPSALRLHCSERAAPEATARVCPVRPRPQRMASAVRSRASEPHAVR